MAPIDETTGVRRRLEHLGYRKAADVSESEDDAKVIDQRAIQSFQQDQALDPSGTLDAATRAKLQEVHGS